METIENLKVGDKVKRKGSSKDYTTGRTGEIVAVANIDQRFRVRWTKERDGSDVTTPGHPGHIGVRTWVNKRFLIRQD